MRWSSSPTLPPRGCPPSPGRPDGEAPDLPDQQRLVPLQSGRQPGPGLSSQLHPTSHPHRTGKPLCATERDGSATRVLRTPGPSLPAGPGQAEPGQLPLQVQQPSFVSGLHQLVHQGGGGETHRHPALAGGQSQPQGDVGLAGAAVADGDDERTPPAAWTQSPGTEERPGGSAARRPEASFFVVDFGGSGCPLGTTKKAEMDIPSPPFL